MWFFLTLTAPSFGLIHRVPRQGQRRCRCGGLHDSDDGDFRGVAIDPDSYEYEGQVCWNRDCGVLWDRTRRRLERLFGARASYAVVRQWQARGALRRHSIIRVPSSTDIAPHEVARAAAAATASIAGRTLAWGTQVDCRPIPIDPVSSAHHIAYLSEIIGYSVKSIGSSAAAPISEHSHRLDAAAHRMRCKPGCGEGGTAVWLLLTAGMAPGHRWFRFHGIRPSPDLPVQSRLKFVEGSLIRFQPSRVTPVVFGVPNGLGACSIRSNIRSCTHSLSSSERVACT